MKKILLFLSAVILTIGVVSIPANAAVKTSKSYMPSSSYKNYTFKNYSVKGKAKASNSLKYITKGVGKGTWKHVGENYYTSFDYYKNDNLYETTGSKASFNSGSGIYSIAILPAKLKKGSKGTFDGFPEANIKYKILSTNSTVKVGKKTYKKTIKVWNKAGSTQTIKYYAKNRGLVKVQTLYKGKYKTTKILSQIKK